MSKKIINVGKTPNDKQGDSLRSAFLKVNENFTELYSAIQVGTVRTPPISSKGAVGDKSEYVAFDADNFYYCIADYTTGIADIWKRVAASTDTW
jgi:hypothetical protein